MFGLGNGFPMATNVVFVFVVGVAVIRFLNYFLNY